jgi:integrase
LTSAVEQVGIPRIYPHELRHTAVSLAIASGADVKVVQPMLGHKSATLTLDLHGHLLGSARDRGRRDGRRADGSARKCAFRARVCDWHDREVARNPYK